ncbi:MAG: peptidoglycan-binding protein [Candidatus Omnitrophica bacterium]|nr:peptidoglycan-binding protein [Candidatus Omnitrophota bacterium]
MQKLYFWVVGVVLLSFFGCATLPEGSKDVEIYRLKARINVLEDELSQKQKENLALKEEVAQLKQLLEERTVFKMPSAKEIQTALKNAGFYDGEIDGQIGSKTKEAIIKFQEANKLTADGVVGSRTWELLRKYLKSSSQE